MMFSPARFGTASSGETRRGLAGRLARLLWHLAIAAYFAAGFVILGARWLVSTQVPEHREEIVALISETAGVKVSAARIDIRFHRIRPVIALENVELSSASGPVSLSLPRVTAELAWSSLWHFEPRFHRLELTDPSLTVRRLSETRFDLAGFLLDADVLSQGGEKPREGDEETADQSRRALAWLLGQNRLQLRNGTFTYVDLRGKEPLSVTVKDVQAVFRQDFLRWRAAVEGTVPEGTKARHFNVRARLDRHPLMDKTDPMSWRGEAYTQFDRIDVSRLMKRLGYQNILPSGSGAARLWASFEEGSLTRVSSELALHDVVVQLGPETAPMDLDRLRGAFTYSGRENRIRFEANNLEFVASGLRFGPSSVTADVSLLEDGTPGTMHFDASSVEIGTLAALAPSLPLPQETARLIQEHELSGVLRNLSADIRGDFRKPENWRLSFGFYRLSLPSRPSSELPGFRNLAGLFTTRRNGEFVLDLASEVSTLEFPGVFRRPFMNFGELRGRVRIETVPALKIFVEGLRASNADASVTAAGSWTADGGLGVIDLSGNLERARAVSVVKYLPTVIGEETLDYLEAALKAGRSSRGSFVLRGPLGDFPWAGTKNGLFLIEADVTDGQMDFMPSGRRNKNGTFVSEEHWPLLRSIRANLRFEGESMTIRGESAASMGLKASNVEVKIPAFSAEPVMLSIRGDVAGDLGQAIGYLRTGKMTSDVLGDLFQKTRASGPANVRLSIDLPLSKPEDFRMSVEGSVSGAGFDFDGVLPAAKNLTGTLLVTEKSLSTPAPFRGSTEAGPVEVRIETKDRLSHLLIEGSVTAREAQKLLDLPGTGAFFERVSGSTRVEVDAAFSMSGPEGIVISGKTDLTGLESRLPAPFEKASGASWPTAFRYEDRPKERRLRIDAGEKLALDLRSPRGAAEKSLTLTSGFIGVGARIPEAGAVRNTDLEIDLHAANLSWDDWSGMAGDFMDAQGTAPALNVPLRGLRLRAASLTLDGRTFSDLDLALSQSGADWTGKIKAQNVSGKGTYSPARGKTPARWNLAFSELCIPESVHTRIETIVKENPPPASLPDLSVLIENLHVGKLNIGKVEVSAENDRTPGLWHLKKGVVYNRGATFSASGTWRPDPKGGTGGKTQAKLSAEISNAGRLLRSLDIKDAIRDGPGSVSADLSWQGSPWEPQAATLSGHFEMKGEAGRILQIEPGAGRILSLLSMQHLLRRLTLDFKDVFARGFAFDHLLAAADIRNGIIHSDRSIISASSAQIVTSGDIDLVNSLLDMKVTVYPSINTEGASLALALANPAVGIGTLLAQFVFKDQISSLLRQEYTVTGDFDNPVVTPVAKNPGQKDARPENGSGESRTATGMRLVPEPDS